MDQDKPTSSKRASTTSRAIGITDRQKQLITASWLVVQSDMEKNSIDLFVSFFKSNPKYLAFFQDVKSAKHTDENLRSISVKVFLGLSGMLDRGFADNAVMKSQMDTIINRHLDRGVLPEYFDDFFQNMMIWLRKELGMEFTDELQHAWTAFVDLFQMEYKKIEKERNKLLSS